MLFAWLKKRPAGPFFVFINLYDAHDPYDPPAPYSERFSESPYDGEIAYVDSCVGKFLSALYAQSLDRNTAFAIMADHGESLGATRRADPWHLSLQRDQVHVPLFFRLPDDHFAGKRVETRVGLVDVAPTLLEIAGFAVPGAVQGESLLRSVERSSPAPSVERHIYSESDYSSQAFGWSALRSLRSGKYLFIDAPRREL